MTLSLVLMIIAVARVTRVITTDVLFEAPRGWVVRKLLEYPPAARVRPGGVPQVRTSGVRYRLAYLISCDWCASIYVGTAGAGAWWAWGETMPFMVTTAALSASYVTGFLASKTEG